MTVMSMISSAIYNKNFYCALRTKPYRPTCSNIKFLLFNVHSYGTISCTENRTPRLTVASNKVWVPLTRVPFRLPFYIHYGFFFSRWYIKINFCFKTHRATGAWVGLLEWKTRLKTVLELGFIGLVEETICIVLETSGLYGHENHSWFVMIWGCCDDAILAGAWMAMLV